MKVVIFAFAAFLLGVNSYAGSDMICKEVGKKSLHRQLILRQIEAGDLKPFTAKRYELVLADAQSKDDVLHVLLKTEGTMTAGDVDLSFESDDQLVTFETYTDEENSGRLSISENVGGQFNCQWL
jgi:hypothetical protein